MEYCTLCKDIKGKPLRVIYWRKHLESLEHKKQAYLLIKSRM